MVEKISNLRQVNGLFQQGSNLENKLPLKVNSVWTDCYNIVNIPSTETKTNDVTALIIEQLNSKKDVNSANGVFLGDRHQQFNISEYIASAMPDFKKAGVNKFYMEMIPEEMQPVIDRYYEKGDNEEEIIKSLKKGWDYGEGASQKYFNIIKAAKENGIKLYGIDEPRGYKPLPHEHSRLERSNPKWARVINNNTKPGDKYIIFGGGGHAANYPENKGIDQLLGDIPSITFNTSNNNKEEIIVGDHKGSDFNVFLPKSPNQPASSCE